MLFLFSLPRCAGGSLCLSEGVLRVNSTRQTEVRRISNGRPPGRRGPMQRPREVTAAGVSWPCAGAGGRRACASPGEAALASGLSSPSSAPGRGGPGTTEERANRKPPRSQPQIYEVFLRPVPPLPRPPIICSLLFPRPVLSSAAFGVPFYFFSFMLSRAHYTNSLTVPTRRAHSLSLLSDLTVRKNVFEQPHVLTLAVC